MLQLDNYRRKPENPLSHPQSERRQHVIHNFANELTRLILIAVVQRNLVRLLNHRCHLYPYVLLTGNPHCEVSRARNDGRGLICCQH